MKPSPTGPRSCERECGNREDHFGSVTGTHAELVFFLTGAKTGSAFFQDEGADAVGFLGFVGNGHRDADVRVGTVGGEGFGAVEHPVITLTNGGGARAAGVRTGFGLSEGPGAKLFSLGEGHEIVFLVLSLPNL